MDTPEPVPLKGAFGFQHADDSYYYRPLVAGEELFMYVAHIPVGGYLPPDAEEAKLFELALFMLDGHLDALMGSEDNVVPLRPGDGLHIPRGLAFGVRNSSAKSASFVLSFSPPPRVGSLDEMRRQSEEDGRTILEPVDFDPIIGETTFPMR